MVNCYVWGCVLFVSFSGFIFGYDVGSINGVKDMIGYRQTLNLSYHSPSMLGGNSSDVESCDSQDDVDTSAILGLIVSLFSVGAFIGALSSGVISDFIGRKPAVIIGAGVVLVGGGLHTGAFHLGMVFVSRIVLGIGVGILYQVTPLYVGEISPENLRGSLLSCLTLYAALGFIMSTIVNVIVKNYVFGWRISVGVISVMGAILALGMVFLPRSPRWLVKKSREDEALKILSKIYKDEKRAKHQLEEIKSEVASTQELGSLLETVKLLLGFFLLLLGRFGGGSFVAYFSVTIFCGVGLPGFAVTIALAITNSAPLIISLWYIDKFGRKPILLIGIVGMFLAHILTAALILGFNLEESAQNGLDQSQEIAAYFILVSMCVFVACFTVSFGNIPWVVAGELFPLKGRGFLISLCSTGFWLGVIVLNQIGPILVSSPLRISGTFLLLAGIVFILFFYVLLLLPETKGHTLEKMDEVLRQPWLKRTNVLYYLRCGCFLELFAKKRKRDEIIIDAGLDNIKNTDSVVALEKVLDSIEVSST